VKKQGRKPLTLKWKGGLRFLQKFPPPPEDYLPETGFFQFNRNLRIMFSVNLFNLLMRWDASSQKDEVVRFYQQLDEEDRKDSHVLVFQKDSKDHMVMESDSLASRHEIKLKNILSKKEIPLLFRCGEEEALVSVVNQVFEASPQTERQTQMQDMLAFVTEHEEIPFDLTMNMLMGAAQGESNQIWEAFMCKKEGS